MVGDVFAAFPPGTVIHRLSEGRRAAQTQHIPYRDSKLTRMLQTSLSGNAHIAIICTVSPAVRCLEETHNTLKFASRAKRIRHRAHVNEVVDQTTLLRQYKAEIDELRAQLAELQARAAVESQEQEDSDSDTEALISQSIAKLERLILRSEKRDVIGSEVASPVRALARAHQSLGGSGQLPGETPFFQKKRRSGSDVHAIALSLHREIGRELSAAEDAPQTPVATPGATTACSPITEEAAADAVVDEDSAFFQRTLKSRHKSLGNIRRLRESGVQEDIYTELFQLLETLKLASVKREWMNATMLSILFLQTGDPQFVLRFAPKLYRKRGQAQLWQDECCTADADQSGDSAGRTFRLERN